MIPCDILIKNAAVLMPDRSIAKNQTIAISENRILEIADTRLTDQTGGFEADRRSAFVVDAGPHRRPSSYQPAVLKGKSAG